jgi:SpoVK/Ycf46/Vps4 family AAA+-type ATPase
MHVLFDVPSLFQVGCPSSDGDRAAVLAVHLRGLPITQSSVHSLRPREQALDDDEQHERRGGGSAAFSSASASPPQAGTARLALARSLAARTSGFTCADLAALCKDAALSALRNHLAAAAAAAAAGPTAAAKAAPQRPLECGNSSSSSSSSSGARELAAQASRVPAPLPPVTAADFEAALGAALKRRGLAL